MRLPLLLQQAIEEEAALFNNQDLIRARKDLSTSYRTHFQERTKPHMSHANERGSYLVSRMPATYAAIFFVLRELCQRVPSLKVESLLDLGAGPGTSLWCAKEFFPQLQKAVLVERDAAMISLGKKLLSHASFPKTEWLIADLEKTSSFLPHDLTICSYSLGELSLERAKEVCLSAFRSSKQMLVIIEPGTPRGFERILQMRRQLLSSGSHMVAPCPHALACPLKEGDWCHFSVRVVRSALHRRVKEASLGYEDEKFSYLIVSQSPDFAPGIENFAPSSKKIRPRTINPLHAAWSGGSGHFEEKGFVV